MTKLNERQVPPKALQTRKTMHFNSGNLSKSMAVSTSSSMEKNEKLMKKQQKQKKLRKTFIDIVLKNLNEMLNDIECVYEEITRQAPEHINQKDVILTFSESDLLVSFLKSAHQGVEDDD